MVVGLSVWNDGEQVKGKSVDYLNFSSEFALRKWNQGWKVLSKLDSRISPLLHIQITVYVRRNNQWTTTKVLYVARTLKEISARTKENENTNIKELISAISSESKFLNVRIYGQDWYAGIDDSDSKSSSIISSIESTEEKLSELWTKGKSVAWIWIENNDGKPLQDLYSVSTFAEKLKTNQKKLTETYERHKCHMNSFFPQSSGCLFNDVNPGNIAIVSIGNAQDKSIGKWVSVEEVCKYNETRKQSAEELKNLKLFCAKSTA